MQYKKNRYFENSNVIIAIVMTVFITILAFSAPILHVTYHKNTRTTIVLDAGHGGIDGGVTGVKTGIKESVLNLKIAKILGEQLTSAGYRVVYTRTNEQGLYSDSSKNKKREDMQNRVKIINNVSARLVLSIHMNYYTSSARRGAQIFFNKKSEESKIFGDILQEKLNKDINIPASKRNYSALAAEKYLLENVSMPIVIAECGFLSNPLDEANLIDERYQMALINTLFQGITIYLSETA